MKSKQQFLIGALVILLIVGATAFFIVTKRQLAPRRTPASDQTKQQQPVDIVPNAADDAAKVSMGAIGGSDAFGKYVVNEKHWYDGAVPVVLRDYTENFIDEPIRVEWLNEHPSFPSSTIENMLKKVFTNYSNPERCAQADKQWDDFDFCVASTIGKAGTIVSPARFKGEQLYYVNIYYPFAGGDFTTYTSIYSSALGKFIFIAPDNQVYTSVGIEKIFSGYINQKFSELMPPKQLALPNDPSRLIKQKTFSFDGGIVENSLDQNDQTFGQAFYHDHEYHIILPNGENVYYDLIPYFLQLTTLPESQKEIYPLRYDALMDWTDGRTEDAKEEYILSIFDTTGCGGRVFRDSDRVNDEPWFSESNLKSVGRTNQGELVYEPKTIVKDDFYHQLYNVVFDSSQPKNDFTDFVSNHPIFFWKDKIGNWHIIQKAKYLSSGECGKPVIYLYPPKDMDVRVQVAPNGGFTKTIPAYGVNGWFVHASPDGQLYNYADKTAYPYLFWEGHASGAEAPKEGFVLAKKDVPAGMRALLVKMGLTSRETEDFMEFWQDKLMVKPYVFVTFVPQREFEAMAPLRITPRPDTVIRVFMDFTPLDAPISVDPLPIVPRARSGFTVVEWGGTLK